MFGGTVETVFHSNCVILHSQQKCSMKWKLYFIDVILSFSFSKIIILTSEVTSCHGFDFNFPNNQWCWAPFHFLIDHLYFFLLWENDYLNLVPILKLDFLLLLLSCKSSFYILDINPLSVIWFGNIFLLCKLWFHSPYTVPWCTEVFNFGEGQFIFSLLHVFFMFYQINTDKINVMKLSLYVLF